MNELSNLVRIVTDRRLATLPLLEFGSKSNTNKELDLVKFLAQHPDSTSLQIVKSMYGKNSPANQTALRKLKSRVQQKLLHHLYFLDQSDPRHLISRQYEVQCVELLHQVNVLQGEGEYKVTEQLLRKCLRLAIEGEFTQYVVQAARALRNMYAELRQPARYQAMAKQLAHYENLLALEDQAGQYYWATKMAGVHTVRSRRLMLDKLPEYIGHMQEIHRKARTFTTFNYLYRTQIVKEELVGNYEALARLTIATARLANQGKINKKRYDKRFNHFITIYAHLRSRQPQKGLKLAEEYFKDFHPSSGNWFYFLEHYVLLAMHAATYFKAHELIKVARKNPYYSKQRPAAQQRWDLFGAYLQFIQPEQSPLRQLHFAQFVLTVPDYSRDKRGHNVAILILQFLYYLRGQDIEGLLTRMEGLRKYQQRHLREPDTLRSQLFLRLLMLTVKENFEAAACEKKGQALLTRLQETPQPGEAFAEIEIIPYEQLWALALDIMKANELELRAAELVRRAQVL